MKERERKRKHYLKEQDTINMTREIISTDQVFLNKNESLGMLHFVWFFLWVF